VRMQVSRARCAAAPCHSTGCKSRCGIAAFVVATTTGGCRVSNFVANADALTCRFVVSHLCGERFRLIFVANCRCRSKQPGAAGRGQCQIDVETHRLSSAMPNR
jgi:hypothetical protein